jgi:hypothetical protein
MPKTCNHLYIYYHFGRVHKTLRVTPAMEAGVADHVWTMTEIAALMDARYTPKPRGPYKKKIRGFQASSDRSSSWLPLTQNLANRAMVRSTISLDFETMIDLRLKRPNQWRCRQWLRSMACVVALLWTSLSGGMTDAYVAH